MCADCQKFDRADGDDFTMEQYRIYEYFVQLVEHKLGEMLKEIGGDLEELVKALMEISEAEATGPRDERIKGKPSWMPSLPDH